MKNLLIFILLFLSQSIFADFTTATKAYSNENYSDAYTQFHQLAVIGNKRAQYNLAVMNLRGDGREKDLVEAYAWLKLAQDEAHPKYVKSLARAKKKLSADQLILAEQKANQLVENYGTEQLSQLLLPIPHADGNETIKASRSYQVEVLKRTQPIYPAKLLKIGHRGWVTVEFTIYPDGTVRDSRVVDAYPDNAFNKASIEAISKWRFKVTFDDGVEPRPVTASNMMQFLIRDDNGEFKQFYNQRLAAARQRAIKENPRSQYLYAIAANAGSYVDKENYIPKTEVNYWLLRSAQNGNIDAQYTLGKNIFYGTGCEADKQKGLFWLTEAANNGNDLAARMAYELLESEDLTNTTGKSAEQWLIQSANAGNPDSMIEWANHATFNSASGAEDLKMARQYLKDSEKDRSKSIRWYLTSAELYKRDNKTEKAEGETRKAEKLAKKFGWEMASLDPGP